MIRILMKSIREYKRPSILAPVLVGRGSRHGMIIIPFVVAQLVNQIKAGAGLEVIGQYGLILVVLAVLSLAFGAGAGANCATGHPAVLPRT